MLDAENGRVLSRQRNIFEPQFLEHRDNRARDTVVGGKYAVDLVAVKGNGVRNLIIGMLSKPAVA